MNIIMRANRPGYELQIKSMGAGVHGITLLNFCHTSRHGFILTRDETEKLIAVLRQSLKEAVR